MANSKENIPARVYVNMKNMELVEEGYPNSEEYVHGEAYRKLYEKNVALASRNAELEKQLAVKAQGEEGRIYNDDISY